MRLLCVSINFDVVFFGGFQKVLLLVVLVYGVYDFILMILLAAAVPIAVSKMLSESGF